MSPNCAPTTIATIGIDLGKNTFPWSASIRAARLFCN